MFVAGFEFDHTHRYSQRAEGEWTGGLSPPPCGQLTRCFSAVAELLVIFIIEVVTDRHYMPVRCITCLAIGRVITTYM